MTVPISNQPVAPKVFLIDGNPDDVLVVRSVCESVGLNVQDYRSPNTFLQQLDPDSAGCIVVDLIMPEMTGLELHEALQRINADLPVVLLTRQADAATCRTAFQKGVFDYLEKSSNRYELLVVIRNAITENAIRRKQRTRRDSFSTKLSSLSPREREVMQLLADGRTLKEVGAQFKISVQTASKHRGKLFQKLAVSNEVELLKQMISVDPEIAEAGAIFAA